MQKNGNKILISRRASSRKTPETASAAEHGLRKRLTVLLLIQGRSNNFFSSPQTSIMIFFPSLSLKGLLLVAPVCTPLPSQCRKEHLRYLTMKEKLQSRIFLHKHELIQLVCPLTWSLLMSGETFVYFFLHVERVNTCFQDIATTSAFPRLPLVTELNHA